MRCLQSETSKGPSTPETAATVRKIGCLEPSGHHRGTSRCARWTAEWPPPAGPRTAGPHDGVHRRDRYDRLGPQHGDPESPVERRRDRPGGGRADRPDRLPVGGSGRGEGGDPLGSSPLLRRPRLGPGAACPAMERTSGTLLPGLLPGRQPGDRVPGRGGGLHPGDAAAELALCGAQRHAGGGIRRDPAGSHAGRDVPVRLHRPDQHLHLPGNAFGFELFALGVHEARCPQFRGRPEISAGGIGCGRCFSLRRFPALRIERWQHQPGSDCRGPEDGRLTDHRPLAGVRVGHGGLQDRRRAIPPVDSRCVRRIAHPGGGLPFGGLQGRRFRPGPAAARGLL